MAAVGAAGAGGWPAVQQVPAPPGGWPGSPGSRGSAAEPDGPGGGAPAGPRVIVLSAGDPANPYGAALPWPARPGEVPGAHRPGRQAGALVVLSPAAAGLAEAVRGGALGRLTVERADGSGVYESPLAQALADAGFRPTPRGLRLRG